MPVPPEARAARWLEVEVLIEPVGRWRMVLRGIRSALWEVFLDWFATTPTVKIKCEVVVKRRDNQTAIAAYDYDNVADARQHETSLNTRLNEMGLFDITRDLGVSFACVEDARPAGP